VIRVRSDLEALHDDALYEHHTITARPGQRTMRVDQFLAANLALSRSRIRDGATMGWLRVNGAAAKASYRIRPGDVVRVLLPWPPAGEPQPEPIPIAIVYEDEDVVVVDKAAGLVAHPAIGHSHGTLLHALLYHLGPGAEPHLVHRLDRDTSGLLLVAKSAAIKRSLCAQLENGRLERSYWALVHGEVAAPRGTIRAHIADGPPRRAPYRVIADGSGGRAAVTHYRVLCRYAGHTLIRCRLETGRTHQIRAHCAHLGHPVVGDDLYGREACRDGLPVETAATAAVGGVLQRQALHSATLVFSHPRTSRTLRLRAPLPRDFREALTLLSCS
jgi:23S rRNA pseudouridine1911/1915/1917 synthase